ncbi:type II toxin-antitoxin system HicB family antitoxin [Thermosynechococcus sp. HN-54]|uniref:type II toxin-antitoxin system HicB family antitoxin n=1 Tax=Thermosynechococcus sp. HN-54 TaxID=2933959 RepID=UPI00202CB3C0|nr:type II toxin-antitoxin system HicB family antitoxin [Thermosynechococcus sp. HN-54]URR34985.1 type II toxin-antitoxin system HicB family antitoxin [Thermosynechococcus sp. HN-54]
MLLSDYMNAALERATYHFNAEDGLIYGEITDLEGVKAHGKTVLECREHLSELLEDWIYFHVSRGIPVPVINGIEVPVREIF